MNKLEQIKEDFKSRNSFEELVTKEECKLSIQNYDWLMEQAEKMKKYEKALEEITRQYDDTTVNRAKEIANEALGELTDERKREIQSY